MWFPSLLLLVAFTNVMADIEEDLQRCTEMVDTERLEDMINMKSSEELGVVCPMFNSFFSCIDEVVKEYTGFTIAKLAKLLEGTEAGKGAQLISNLQTVLNELCTEGSQLNEDYMADIECYDTIEDPTDVCESNAIAAYEAYKEFEDAVQEEARDNTNNDDRNCMQLAYQSACIAAIIHEKCGRRAFDTYNTIVKRTTIFRNALCSPKGLEDLKTTFVESLEMDEPQRDLYRLAFDLRKRRK